MFRLHYAASPEEAAATFPWGYVNVTLDDYSWAFPGNWNPAPTLLKNGSLRVMAHDSWRSMAGTAIFQSHGVANYAGPFRLITDDQAPGWVGDTHGTEDNFYWVDAAGNHHVLYHWLAGHAWNGGHSWSKDGFRWTNVSAAFNGSVPLEGGGHLGCNRQRPKLLMNEEGTPTHLYTGCGTFEVEFPSFGTYLPSFERSTFHHPKSIFGLRGAFSPSPLISLIFLSFVLSFPLTATLMFQERAAGLTQ